MKESRVPLFLMPSLDCISCCCWPNVGNRGCGGGRPQVNTGGSPLVRGGGGGPPARTGGPPLVGGGGGGPPNRPPGGGGGGGIKSCGSCAVGSVGADGLLQCRSKQLLTYLHPVLHLVAFLHPVLHPCVLHLVHPVLHACVLHLVAFLHPVLQQVAVLLVVEVVHFGMHHGT